MFASEPRMDVLRRPPARMAAAVPGCVVARRAGLAGLCRGCTAESQHRLTWNGRK